MGSSNIAQAYSSTSEGPLSTMAIPMPMPGMPGMSVPPNVRPLPQGTQPPLGAQGLPPGMPPPGTMQIRVDPAMQQLLDSIPYTDVPFHLQQQPVPNTTPPQINTLVLCPMHKQSACEQCGVDFNGINYLHQFLRMAPSDAIPPPPQVQPLPQRAEQIKMMKEQGNVSRPRRESLLVLIISRSPSKPDSSQSLSSTTPSQQIWRYLDHLGSFMR